MRYQIISVDGVVEDITNSFAQAVAYARANEWNVYDTDVRRFVYNGYLDEYYAMERSE